MEGLPLTDLFAYLNTRRAFRNFQVWGFKRVLGVLRAARECDTDVAEAVIAALELLAVEDRVLLVEANGDTVLFLTEKGRDKGEDWK